jgi:hypothetical protein
MLIAGCMRKLSAIELGILATRAVSAPAGAVSRRRVGFLPMKSSITRRVLAVAVLLGLAFVPATSAPQERIVNRQDADRFFGLSRPQWEAEAREMVESQGWKIRPTPADTGTSVMTMDPKTGVGLGVQPVFRDLYGPPTTLVVGSYYPAGTFRRFSVQAQRDLEAAVSTNLGAPYSVSVSFSTQALPPPGFDLVELVITRSRH